MSNLLWTWTSTIISLEYFLAGDMSLKKHVSSQRWTIYPTSFIPTIFGSLLSPSVGSITHFMIKRNIASSFTAFLSYIIFSNLNYRNMWWELTRCFSLMTSDLFCLQYSITLDLYGLYPPLFPLLINISLATGLCCSDCYGWSSCRLFLSFQYKIS